MDRAGEISAEALAELTSLYEDGLYVQACARAATLPPVAQWRGTAARLIGGRLAGNVHAPRLARWLHLRAWRDAKTDPEAAYYFALNVLQTRGPLAAWKFLRGLRAFPHAAPSRRADFLTIRARVAGHFRDFETATALMAEAELLDGDRPWLWVEKSWLHEAQDTYEEALAASRRALELRPHFRPAVQAAAHQLQLLGRDEEALAVLLAALDHVESAAIAVQLASLQTELGQPRAALESWQRVRLLSPWMEPKANEWWEGRMSDALYFAGDRPGAIAAAARAKHPFYEKLVERLQAPPPDARRVLLPVGFVRQHHFTCAPATLSALGRFWNFPVDHLALAAAICYDGTPDHIERHWAEENGWHAREFCVTWPVLVALLDRGVPFTLTTVETQSAHLQAVIGYDSFRGTLLIRDPYERTHGEYLAEEFLERYAASGPRGMLLLPSSELPRLEQIELPEAPLYDELYRLHRALHGYDRDAAQQHFKALERADPAHRLTLQARRSLAWYDASLPQQLAAVEELLTRYPKNGNFLRSKLSALRELTRRSDYHEFLRQLAAEKDSEPLFWREWAGELSQDARHLGDARRLLLGALRRRPVDPDNLHALANLLWDLREFAEATELYRFAATLRDKTDFFTRSYFRAARHLRQTEAALGLIKDRFEKFGRQSGQPAKLLFWALTMLARQPQAISCLEAALALRPDDGDLLLFAADAYARHGNPERGDALLASAEKRAPQTEWLRTAANLADYRCELVKALGFWRQILAEEPLALDAQRAVTRLLAETEGREKALEHLRETCAQFDHHVGLHELWADWARDKGWDALDPVLCRLIELHPENAWAHRELALLRSAQGRFEDATAELDIVAQLEPHAPTTPAVRAQAALNAGRLAEAREHSRAALLLSIDHDSAIRDLLAASPSFEEKREAVAFVREQLIRQVVFGDGLLAYREAAFEIVEPHELLASLREALAARPDLWHAWSAVVHQFVDVQQLDAALELAQQATERFPLLARLWLDLAQVHQARREREAEIAPLRRALQLSPSWGYASRRLSATYERMGQYDQAAHVLEQAIAAAPLDPYNHGFLADTLWHLERRDEAVARLEHALRLDPGYDWAWDALRSWSPEGDENNRAVVLARDLTKLRAGEARSWYFLAQSLADSALEERLAALDRALDLNPRFYDAHDFRAELLAEAGRFDEAANACRPASLADRIPTRLHGRAAWVEAQRGKLRAAIAQMRAVVADSPDYEWGWRMLADWHTEDRDFERAREAAEKLVRLDPRSAGPLGCLADIQRALGAEEAAIETLRRAFHLDPTYAFAGFALFDRHIEKREDAEAEELLKILRMHHPGARVLAAAVRLHCRRGRREEAIAALRELCVVPEDETPALLTATEAMQESGWPQEIERALHDGLSDDTANPEIGALWARAFVARRAWKYVQRLHDLDASRPLGRRARIAFLEACGEHRLAWRLHRFVSRERAWLHANDHVWGTVAYAYVCLDRYKEVLRWMEDWPKRTGLEPWMLVNLVSALRGLRRDTEATEVNRHALALRPDHTTPFHQLWVGFEAALTGDVAGAQAATVEVREHDLDSSDLSLHRLMRSVVAVLSASADARFATFKEQRRLLRDHRADFDDQILRRAHRRALRAMARTAGIRWRWPWCFC